MGGETRHALSLSPPPAVHSSVTCCHAALICRCDLAIMLGLLARALTPSMHRSSTAFPTVFASVLLQLIEEPVRGGELPWHCAPCIGCCAGLQLACNCANAGSACRHALTHPVCGSHNYSSCSPTGNAPDGGKPVAQRNNEFDNLLINYDGAVSSHSPRGR